MGIYDFLWARLSLPRKFLFAGGIVMLIAMLFVGNWVAKRIEEAVLHNSATTVALYMDSFISPLSQELKGSDQLSDITKLALSEIFNGTAVGDRVVSVKIWKKGGVVAYATDDTVVGKSFPTSEALKNAYKGQISATLGSFEGSENAYEASLGIPLLEVYSPITEPWTGEIIAVSEFYVRAEILHQDMWNAKWSSWMVVGLSFLVSGVLLYGIVQAGGSTIRQQQKQLLTQLAESQKMAKQNASLKQRVVDASGRATAQSERALRDLGAELHDGPAQYISLAALRLESILPKSKKSDNDGEDIKHALNTALSEIRALSRGLAVPDLDSLTVPTVIARAIQDHNRHNNQNIEVPSEEVDNIDLGYTSKLCIFRFIQESLSNSLKHNSGSMVEITCAIDADTLSVTVSDNGSGFDTKTALKLREDGGQGLMGLIDRAESIGGNIDIQSTIGVGTKLTLSLPIQKG